MWGSVARQTKSSAALSVITLIEADAYDHIFPVMAHDASLDDVVDFYPKFANNWMAKGWKDESRWGFLGTFAPNEEDLASTLDDSRKDCAETAESRKDSRASSRD